MTTTRSFTLGLTAATRTTRAKSHSTEMVRHHISPMDTTIPEYDRPPFGQRKRLTCVCFYCASKGIAVSFFKTTISLFLRKSDTDCGQLCVAALAIANCSCFHVKRYILSTNDASIVASSYRLDRSQLSFFCAFITFN